MEWSLLPSALRAALEPWVKEYQTVHEVAHWDDVRKLGCNYEELFNSSARKAEELWVRLARVILPVALDDFAAVIWEDHDECLDVRPEDIEL
jgi:hypothetical protein